jgi:hypothetical protein
MYVWLIVEKLDICTLAVKVGIGLVEKLLLLRQVGKCKICKRYATCCFATKGGGFVLLCEDCFETFNIFYKREIRQQKEEGTILKDELENYV